MLRTKPKVHLIDERHRNPGVLVYQFRKFKNFSELVGQEEDKIMYQVNVRHCQFHHNIYALSFLEHEKREGNVNARIHSDNPTCNSRCTVTWGRAKMTFQVPDIQLNRPFVPLIRDDPVPHFPATRLVLSKTLLLGAGPQGEKTGSEPSCSQ